MNWQLDSESFNPRPTNCKKEETAAIDSTEESGKNPGRIRKESGKNPGRIREAEESHGFRGLD